MLRIAHVISGLVSTSGGTTTAVIELLRWQALLGEDVTLITGMGSDADICLDGLTNVGVNVVGFPIFGPKFLRYTPRLMRYLKKTVRNFDLFVLHSSYQYPTFAASRCCKHAQIPYILMPHGSLDPAVRRKHSLRNHIVDFLYHDEVIRSAAALHFTSEGERIRCERRVWKESFVEALGFDLASIPMIKQVGSFRDKYAIPRSAKLLLFLSRITRKKGIDILLEAFKRIASKNADLYLVLSGPIDPDMSSQIERFRQISRMGNRLILTGHVSGDLKDAVFFDADYFVLPTYSENFGIAAFEALAYGLPVITTTGMDLHAELAKTGRVRIVEPNADALTKVLAEIAEVGWRPPSSVETVRSWLEHNYSWRVRGANILGHYTKWLDETPVPIREADI